MSVCVCMCVCVCVCLCVFVCVCVCEYGGAVALVGEVGHRYRETNARTPRVRARARTYPRHRQNSCDWRAACATRSPGMVARVAGNCSTALFPLPCAAQKEARRVSVQFSVSGVSCETSAVHEEARRRRRGRRRRLLTSQACGPRHTGTLPGFSTCCGRQAGRPVRWGRARVGRKCQQSAARRHTQASTRREAGGRTGGLSRRSPRTSSLLLPSPFSPPPRLRLENLAGQLQYKRSPIS